jgi:hypothetical protein
MRVKNAEFCASITPLSHHSWVITKIFTPQLVQCLFGINWFGFSGLFGSACLFVNTSREKRGKEKVVIKQSVTIYI